MNVSPAQALAFRVAAQGLAARDGAPLDMLSRGWAFQDSPPGAVAAGLTARCDGLAADWLDGALHDERSVVALYNPRTATALVPAADVATFTAALLPHDEAGWRLVLGRAIPAPGEGIAPAEALDAALPAFEQALDGRELSRDDLHAELRERLPDDLLPWCEGCQSHHARRGLLVAACLHGRLCIAGKARRQPLFARTDQWIGPGAAPETVDREAARAELVRRHLRWYGPTTAELFAQWAGVTPEQARASWGLVSGELAEVELDGGRRVALLADDRERLEAALLADGRGRSEAALDDGHAGGTGVSGRTADDAVRLLPAGDPLLLARDRELLVPDPADRRRVWAAINGPGVVLAGGAFAALWRGRKRGRRLAVELTSLEGPLPRTLLAAVEREAERLAPHRGCTSVEVAVA
jgi:hypothetical protein